MKLKIDLLGLMAAALLLAAAQGLAAPPLEQPPPTSYMRSQVGTPNELSPLAPAEASNIRKQGSQWTCELNGQTMVYNEATSRWEPGTPKEPQK